MEKHKVFISYYHKENQEYKNLLEKMDNDNGIFINMSVRDGDIDDDGMTAEQIRIKIRDEYIRDSTVLILLCGKNTKGRKHIDWEIHAAMYNTEKNPQMGILIINLPSSNNNIRRASIIEGDLITNSTKWYKIETREQYEDEFPNMPERIIDNFIQEDVKITVVNWEKIYNNSSVLAELIHLAFNRRKNQKYDTSRRLRRKNSPLKQ